MQPSDIVPAFDGVATAETSHGWALALGNGTVMAIPKFSAGLGVSPLAAVDPDTNLAFQAMDMSLKHRGFVWRSHPVANSIREGFVSALNAVDVKRNLSDAPTVRTLSGSLRFARTPEQVQDLAVVAQAVLEGQLHTLLTPEAKQFLAAAKAKADKAQAKAAAEAQKFARSQWPTSLGVSVRETDGVLYLRSPKDAELIKAFKASKGSWNRSEWCVPKDQETALGKRLVKLAASRGAAKEAKPGDLIAALSQLPGVAMSQEPGAHSSVCLRFGYFEPLVAGLKKAGGSWWPQGRAWVVPLSNHAILKSTLRSVLSKHGENMTKRVEVATAAQNLRGQQAEKDALDPASPGRLANYPKLEGLSAYADTGGVMKLRAPYLDALLPVMRELGAAFSKDSGWWTVPGPHAKSALGHALAKVAPELRAEMSVRQAEMAEKAAASQAAALEKQELRDLERYGAAVWRAQQFHSRDTQRPLLAPGDVLSPGHKFAGDRWATVVARSASRYEEDAMSFGGEGGDDRVCTLTLREATPAEIAAETARRQAAAALAAEVSARAAVFGALKTAFEVCGRPQALDAMRAELNELPHTSSMDHTGVAASSLHHHTRYSIDPARGVLWSREHMGAYGDFMPSEWVHSLPLAVLPASVPAFLQAQTGEGRPASVVVPKPDQAELDSLRVPELAARLIEHTVSTELPRLKLPGACVSVDAGSPGTLDPGDPASNYVAALARSIEKARAAEPVRHLNAQQYRFEVPGWVCVSAQKGAEAAEASQTVAALSQVLHGRPDALGHLSQRFETPVASRVQGTELTR